MTEIAPSPLNNVITIDDERIKNHLDRVVRGSVEETRLIAPFGYWTRAGTLDKDGIVRPWSFAISASRVVLGGQLRPRD